MYDAASRTKLSAWRTFETVLSAAVGPTVSLICCAIWVILASAAVPAAPKGRWRPSGPK